MLKTVRVPAEMEPIFAIAEEAVSRFFRSRKDDPDHGTIEIFGERYILVRAASLSVEFFGLVEQLFGAGRSVEADEFARNILFDLAHAVGKSDARNFHRKMNLGDPIAKLSAGPVHFSHTGWAFVDISAESRPSPDDDFYLLYDHPYSFESDAWLRAGRLRQFPACTMNAGWSSGWCEESFGVQLVSSEVMCRARGDAACRFIMAPPHRIEAYVRAYLSSHLGGEKVGSLYEIPDFFARKRAEEELQTLYQRLKELDTLKTQFFANVSHELRTPLMLISGPVEKLLRDDRLTEDQRSSLEVVHRNSRLLLKQVNDLLDVAKLEAQKMELRYARFDLAELVRFVAGNFDALAAERRIAFHVETGPALVAIASPEKMERVLLNLVSNAFKFATAGGAIRVSLGADGGNARIEVADSGPGVRPELRQVIFERFRQGETGPSRRFGGTGLGLAIVKDFVELHGGKITVGDAPEGGALFVVEFPLVAPAGVEVQEGSLGAASVDRGESSAARQLAELQLAELRPSRQAPLVTRVREDAPTVLAVEDNPDMLRFVADALGTEYRVEIAANGEEGLDKARALKPDLIVTDIMMPKVSGDELVRQIRASRDLDAIPIIVLTARADDELRVRLLGQGAQDYLAKPFSADELLARVRNLVAVKRTRDILQAELTGQRSDLEQLALEVTEKKRELQEALGAMRVARDEAERASRAKTNFLGLVSHELTTPLQSMQLNLEFLQRKPESFSSAQVERIGRITRSSNRLREMIAGLLEFVRLESGKLEVHHEEVSLTALAGAVLEDLGVQAGQKGLTVRLTATDGLPPAHTDAKLFRLILVNLVGNAIKYTDQGNVEIRLDHDGHSHCVRVMDTGHGIPLELQETIFEPFTQLEELKQKHLPGVGLGLTLVRELVKALGGQISLVSRVGQGSTFTVVLRGS